MPITPTASGAPSRHATSLAPSSPASINASARLNAARTRLDNGSIEPARTVEIDDRCAARTLGNRPAALAARGGEIEAADANYTNCFGRPLSTRHLARTVLAGIDQRERPAERLAGAAR